MRIVYCIYPDEMISLYLAKMLIKGSVYEGQFSCHFLGSTQLEHHSERVVRAKVNTQNSLLIVIESASYSFCNGGCCSDMLLDGFDIHFSHAFY